MEIWKDIKGLEMKYQISNLGCVKRLSYETVNRHGKYFLKEKKKKNSKNNYGYACVSIQGKLFLIHRLIADAFIPNPYNKPCINHKDGDKNNNAIINLEWCTKAENNKHAYDNNLKVGYWTNKSGKNHHSSKEVTQKDVFDNIINVFGSTSEASRITKFCQSKISKACLNRKIYKQFKWEYTNTLKQ